MINLNIEKDAKVYRILDIYSKLLHGDILNKKEMANLYNVNEKTIQRADLRTVIIQLIGNIYFNKKIILKNIKNHLFIV